MNDCIPLAITKDPFNLEDYFTAGRKTSIISKITPRQFLS
jgi:hypothetical protein